MYDIINAIIGIPPLLGTPREQRKDILRNGESTLQQALQALISPVVSFFQLCVGLACKGSAFLVSAYGWVFLSGALLCIGAALCGALAYYVIAHRTLSRLTATLRQTIAEQAQALSSHADHTNRILVRKQFLAAITHDLKSPLSVIQGHAELIKYSVKPG